MRIDGYINGFQANGIQSNNNNKTLLEGLQQGDIIKAQILDIKVGEMILRLSDGSTVRAVSMVQLQAKPGDTVSFAFKENVNGKILVETLKPEMLVRQELISPETINTKQLMGDNQSTDSKSTSSQLSQILKGMQIKPDDNNLKLAQSMLDQGISLTGESFENIKKIITEFPEITPKKIVFLLANGIEPDENNIEMLNKIVEGNMKSGILIQKLEDAIKQLLDKTFNQDSVQINAHAPGQGLGQKPGQILGQALDQELGQIPDGIPGQISGQAPGKANDPEDARLLLKLLQDIKELPVSLKAASAEKVQQKLEVLKKQIVEKIAPENLLPGQMEKLQSIRKGLSSVPDKIKEEINTIINDLEKGIEFYKEVSKQNYFYQIPLYLGEKTAAGELYILKNRAGAKRFDKNGLTACLTMDTERMGVVDAYVNMSGKTLGIQFRAENSETLDSIREYTIDLYKVFNEKGYKLAECTCKLKNTEDSVNIADACEKVRNPWLTRGRPLDIKV